MGTLKGTLLDPFKGTLRYPSFSETPPFYKVFRAGGLGVWSSEVGGLGARGLGLWALGFRVLGF